MAEYCEKCKELRDRLDAVLMANNQWRLEMWALRLDSSLWEAQRTLIAIIMDRQLEIEEKAKADPNGGERAEKEKGDR